MNFMRHSYLQNVLHPLRTLQRVWQYHRDAFYLYEIFGIQTYYWLATKLKPHTTLIDLGAYIGDTAAYFTMFPQVDKLIGYESDPVTYERAIEFLRNNPQRQKISLHKKEVGKDLTLDEILKGHTNIAIKCDIEGAEHGIFTWDADLSHVYAIQMEYYHGVQKLTEMLESKKFKVETKQWNVDKQLGEMGDLRAWKD